jgi:hypothetical protein
MNPQPWSAARSDSDLQMAPGKVSSANSLAIRPILAIAFLGTAASEWTAARFMRAKQYF